MSVSTVNNNLATLLNQTYGTNNSSSSTTLNTLINDLANTVLPGESTSSGSSTAVTLGASTNATQTYNAQGIINQLQQYQLSNDSLLFGTSSSKDNSLSDLTSLLGNNTSSTSSLLDSTATSTNTSLSQNTLESALKNDPNGALQLLESAQMSSINNLFSSN